MCWVLWCLLLGSLADCVIRWACSCLPFCLPFVSPLPPRPSKLDTFPLCSQTSPSLRPLTEQSFIKLFHALSGGGPWGLEFVSSLCWSSTGSSSLVSSQLLRVAGLQEQMLKGLPFIYLLLLQSCILNSSLLEL